MQHNEELYSTIDAVMQRYRSLRDDKEFVRFGHFTYYVPKHKLYCTKASPSDTRWVIFVPGGWTTRNRWFLTVPTYDVALSEMRHILNRREKK